MFEHFIIISKILKGYLQCICIISFYIIYIVNIKCEYKCEYKLEGELFP